MRRWSLLASAIVQYQRKIKSLKKIKTQYFLSDRVGKFQHQVFFEAKKNMKFCYQGLSYECQEARYP